MKLADYDPCFSCALPDYDEASKKCDLRTAKAKYPQLKNWGARAPEEVKLRRRSVHQERYGQFRRENREVTR